MWEKQESKGGIWMPEKEGEELIGLVQEITAGDYGKQYLIHRDGTEETVKTPSHKVLQAMMTKVAVGDKVKIVFVRQDPPSIKGQQGPKIYEVYVEKPDEQIVE